jgi:hypothetical protein
MGLKENQVNITSTSKSKEVAITPWSPKAQIALHSAAAQLLAIMVAPGFAQTTYQL